MRHSPSFSRPVTRLFLDHGADEAAAERVQIEERGVTFESPWEFPVMSEVAICLAWEQPRLGTRRMPAEGVVLGSRKVAAGRYETTVLFLEMPEEQRESVREFALLSRGD